MNRWIFALLCAILVPVSAQAQCQTFSAIPYGSYVDGGGQTQDLLLDLLIPKRGRGAGRISSGRRPFARCL